MANSSDTSSDRKVTPLLAIAILIAPGLFVWLLLRRGHSNLARILGFSWAGTLTMISMVVILPQLTEGMDEARRQREELRSEKAKQPAPEHGKEQRESGVEVGADPSEIGDFEDDAVADCEIKVKENLVSGSSFETRGPRQFIHFGTIGTVRQGYSATNGFGARVDASFRCKYDAETKTIIALEIFGPFGKRVIVSSDGPGVDELTREQRIDRLRQIEEGAARATNNRNVKQPTGSKPVRWITNFFMAGCPKPSDWFKMQDAVQRGDMTVGLPSHCMKIQPGTVIITEPEGLRETVTYNGHDYQKATLENGREFWTDEMDKISISPH